MIEEVPGNIRRPVDHLVLVAGYMSRVGAMRCVNYFRLIVSLGFVVSGCLVDICLRVCLTA